MLDDLTDESDLAFGFLRVLWRIAGPYTFLLSFAALVFAVVGALGEDGRLLPGVIAVLLGFTFGFITDLLTRYAMRPLAKLAGIAPKTWLGDLLLGLPIAVLLLVVVTVKGWI